MKKIIIAIIIGVFFLAVSIGAIFNELTISIVEESNFYDTEERLQLVLDYCNDKSGFKNSILIYHSNTTHSIDNINCKWKMNQNYPNSENLCIPYVDKWIGGEDWRNQTHYFDTDSCKWKYDPEYDALNSKGCPQFCPKEETPSHGGNVENFDDNYEEDFEIDYTEKFD